MQKGGNTLKKVKDAKIIFGDWFDTYKGTWHDVFIHECLKPMVKCCALHQSPRPQRRINGMQLPLNYQQVIGWVVFMATASFNFLILLNVQFDELKLISLVVFIVLYMCHIVSHLAATIIDPSEKDLRKLEVHNVPEFDRSLHAHVIENGRCHLCNVNTSSRRTKHCSICNKCVDIFDHHCKWLNNCIGRRNYVAFFVCVTTALMISAYTSALCLTDIVIFYTNPKQLSIGAQNYINCTTAIGMTPTYCKNSVWFLTFLTIFCVISLAIGCALLHLLCFHVYISVLGVSTYEYVVMSGDTDNYKKCKCGRMALPSKLYKISKTKQASVAPDNSPAGSDLNEPPGEEANMIHFISILINGELDKARKMFLYDKNKIHPHEENSSR